MRTAPVPEGPTDFIRECLATGDVRWTYHVTMRLGQRALSSEMLVEAAGSLEIIESYPEDKYLPSYLMRGVFQSRVFHAHIATDVEGHNIRVITMYTPTAEEWDLQCRVRRRAQ